MLGPHFAAIPGSYAYFCNLNLIDLMFLAWHCTSKYC